MKSFEGKRGLLAAVGFFFCSVFLFFVIVRVFFWGNTPVFGVTYSSTHAQYLGLDPKETYLAALHDLEIRKFRIPVYWSQIEGKKDTYDWSMIDFFMDEAHKHDAKITLVVGNKVPRWPECHTPAWAQKLSSDTAYENALLQFVSTAVERYKDSPALERWQVENEALFPFGECPPANPSLLKNEVALVRNIDAAHPIQLTVSGEQEAWVDLASLADVIGVSLYRIAWNASTGFVLYPHGPEWYALHRLITAPWIKEMIISELQAEPWLEDGKIPPDIVFAYNAFPVERLRENVRFARQTQFPEVYLWGVEWWYYLHKHGEDRLWEEGKRIFAN